MTTGDALRSGVVFRGSTRLQLRNVSQPEGGRLVTDEVDPVQLPLDCTACDMKASYRRRSSGQDVRRSIPNSIKGGHHARHLETKSTRDFLSHCIGQLYMSAFECADVLGAYLDSSSEVALGEASSYSQVSEVFLARIHDHHVSHSSIQHCEAARQRSNARIGFPLLPLGVGRCTDAASPGNLRATESRPGSGVPQAARIEAAEAALHRWYSTVTHNVTRLFLVAHDAVIKQIGYHGLFKPDAPSKV